MHRRQPSARDMQRDTQNVGMHKLNQALASIPGSHSERRLAGKLHAQVSSSADALTAAKQAVAQ